MDDPNQFGNISGSSTVLVLTSTVLALISMVHKWLEATDGNGATVWVFLFDYRKAFDLIDHSMLVRKWLVCPQHFQDVEIRWRYHGIGDYTQRSAEQGSRSSGPNTRLVEDKSVWDKLRQDEGTQHQFQSSASSVPRACIDGNSVESAQCAKLLGVMINVNITWNDHT